MTIQGPVTAADDGKITCHIDGARVHSIQLHIRDNYAEWTIEKYQEKWPDAPLLSPKAEELRRQKKEQGQRNQTLQASTTLTPSIIGTGEVVVSRAFMHEVFGLGDAPAARSKTSGAPIEIDVLSGHGDGARPYIPAIDPNYVFNIDLVKKVMIGFYLGFNCYFWGYHGTGKTTIFEQCCARTGRPFMRVQHTINTEESHILGQYVVRGGATVFELGPLPLAMLNGWTYCADEYDFAMPSVSAVYQPVLEHKSLIIKEAPAELRVIKPHPQFRFVATGNTNGVGDETGLYQGTLIQNAANYSRFEITEEVKYMDPEIEKSVVMAQTKLDKKNAEKVVKFANQIRESFAQGKMSMTVSPRELINASTLAIAYGGDMIQGLELAFANRLSRIDRQVASQFAQRVFGS